VLSAGYEWLDLAAFKRAGIPVANNGGANARQVAAGQAPESVVTGSL
jgi:phosphoglycerate dehydrogenase-like enzyme